LGVAVNRRLINRGQSSLHLAGGTHYKAAWGDGGALCKEGAGGYDAAFAYDHTVEQGRPHADEAAGLDGAAVERDGVAYGDVGAEDEGVFVLHDVEDRAVLDVCACADADVVDIAADNAERPDAGVFADDDVTDDDRSAVNVSGGSDLRVLAFVRANVGLA